MKDGNNGSVNKTHEMSHLPVYWVYRAMLARCSNEKNENFRRYGGRGIKVCEQWSGPGGFETFFKDMGDCPEGMTIDRKKNDEGYSPENCLWASRTAQARNTRRNRIVDDDQEKLTLVEMAEKHEIPYKVLHQRLSRGWSLKDATTVPLKFQPKRS